MPAAANDVLLAVEDLTIRFPGAEPVTRIGFSVAAGETVAVVGESGSGKSLTALAVMGLLPASARIAQGSIRLGGTELVGLGERRMADLRGDHVAMIFQEPMTSLNPVMSIGRQIAEVVRRHRTVGAAEAWRQAVEALDRVRIPDARNRAHDFPHQLSGGQRQRVMIAMATVLQPKLLVADEPTTALDATVQARVLELLDDLRRDLGMGLLLITHDLGVVGRWSDRVIVMHRGRTLEALRTSDLGRPGRHPYTTGLLQTSVRIEDGVHYAASSLAEIRPSARPDGTYDYAIRPAIPRRIEPHPASQPILEVKNLTVDYATGSGATRALDDVSIVLKRGETLGIVGESGSGKSTLSKAIMQLVPSTGTVRFRGKTLSALPERAMRVERRHVQMIFQDPFGSLNPRKSVGHLLETPLAVNGVGDRHERARRIREMLDHVGLPQASLARHPHEFSGGQRQRIGIARALILRPSLVICDEPVSALDVSIQAQILNLLVDLKQEFGLSYLFISHDLAVVRFISDRVAVMREARIVEEADHRDIWRAPKTDYTRMLIAAASGSGRAHRASPDLATEERAVA
ncbi:ABC transporter ATP-binding protein [Aureimonas sp. ME7]|uniref:ABC transporter ATP-binding protein n=1 Tax=Aureimonas sp. ME7 TaxID=2744252 RepID=UPI0015F373C5|nr:ABC transporter ATP-binding protein [Aureimonas sp. ME7]